MPHASILVMPHKHVRFDPWVQALVSADLRLGQIVIEAVVTQAAALDAGAASRSAPGSCRAKFANAETTLAALQDGRVRPRTNAAWKQASDALRKYTQALECAPRSRRHE